MANIKFFKKATRPTGAGVGSVWFDSTRKAIVLTGATAADDVIYGGCITDAVVEGEKLILTKTDGTKITVDFAVFATDQALSDGLATKVDKVDGKGLSTNDFTTAEKNKLAGIATGANAYSLPAASSSVLGGVKVGKNLSISDDGVLSGTPDTHYTGTFKISGAGTAAATFDQQNSATLNIAAGTGISVSASVGTITIANTAVNTHLINFLDIQAAGTSVVKYTQNSDKTLKFVAGSNVTLTPDATNGTITIASSYVNTDTKVTSVGNHYTPSGGTEKTNGNVLTSVTCDAAGHVTSVSGRDNIPTNWLNGSIPASMLSGTIDIARLPAGALERLFVFDTKEAAMASTDVQDGDTVQIGDGGQMYFCYNASATTFDTRYKEYTAGSATSVPWSGVDGKPTKLSQFTNDSGFTTNKGTVTSVTAGSGLTGGTFSTSGTISHAVPSSVPANITASGRKYITGISLDTFGHVVGLTTGTETVTDTHYENTFSVVSGTTTVVSFNQKANKSLTLAAGSNVTLTPDATNAKVTIAAKDTTYSAGAGLALSGTTFNLVWEEYE